MRFYYEDGEYYDDCALRNMTAYSLGDRDSAIDPAALNQLPQLLPASATAADLATFNQSLYLASNGVIIDELYCNCSTIYLPPSPPAAPTPGSWAVESGSSPGAAGSGLRWRAWSALAPALAVLAVAWLGQRV
ncbi:hypothetical protein GPECTOR_6g630 [Gonium pectorale]|uniref:Uncharacterized protein n=1 Tax=Gonium pectorale TaxID=33097 RepID=A0A150GVC5_GONPE|nr:hypothetical protein GPECTOR_6g630 [Gonium pectorale]|eukprot:KXZ53713.1 hypothetical protein GPECTOR_6g630 [Gonium pectorale]